MRSFTDKDTHRVFQRVASKHHSIELQRAAYRKLTIMDAADAISDLRIPLFGSLDIVVLLRKFWVIIQT